MSAAEDWRERYRDTAVLAVKLGEFLRAVPMEDLFEEYDIDPERYGEVAGEVARILATEREAVSRVLDGWTPFRTGEEAVREPES